MKLRVIWTGKTRNRQLGAVTDDYIHRIRHFVGLDLVELREPRTADDRKRIVEEGNRIEGRLDASDYVIVLDDAGQHLTSSQFANMINDHMTDGRRDLAFVVGGPAGLSPSLKERADLSVSLSSLTLSHDLARIVLVEQLYRALTIIRNLPYAR